MDNKSFQRLSIDKKISTEDNPLVTIVTPILNGVKYLEENIVSILNQSYPNIEHIIIDAGSTDGSREMILSYQAKHPDRIRSLFEPDRHNAEAGNKGWAMGKGEIYGWISSDDYYKSDAVMTVVEFFRDNPDACFVYGGCHRINEKGELKGRFRTKDFNLQEVLNDVNCIPNPSAFYKRVVIDRAGPMNTREETSDELEFWIKVGKLFTIHRIDKVLSNFREHNESIGYREGAIRRNLRDSYAICRRHGMSLFSPRARRYYTCIIADTLRPVLGFTYPLLVKVRKAIRWYPD